MLAAGRPETLFDVEMADTTEITVRLRDLLAPVRAGLTYPVVFEFQRTAPLRAELPVANPDGPR